MDGSLFRSYRLEDVCDILHGELMNKADTTPDGAFPVFSGGTDPMGYTDKVNRKGNMTIVSIQGSAGAVSYSWGPFWQSSFNVALDAHTDIIRPRYLYHAIKTMEPILIAKRLPSMVPSITVDTLRSLWIAVPVDLMTQQRISEAMDEWGYIVDIKYDGGEELRKLAEKRNAAIRNSLLSFKSLI